MHSTRSQLPARLELRRSLTLALVATLSLAGCTREPQPEASFEGPRNVLLISLDTLRADACSLYGYEKKTTPFLEELAERAVVFENHLVNSNNTLTSHATMLTGLLMMAHKADSAKGTPLSEEHITVTERFQEAGFATIGLASHEIWLSKAFGIDQGFDTFESAWKNDAPRINARFVDWLEEEKPRRFFGFLHYYDAHSELAGQQPYSAPPEYLERFAPQAPEGFNPSMENPKKPGEIWHLAKYLNWFQPKHRPLPEGYADYMRGCYDAGVAKLDDDIRALFTELDHLGVLDDTLIVITSDHGEEFEDHGGVLHNSYYEEIVHVPLMIVPPRTTATQGSRVSSTSRAVDLTDTLLDMASLPPLETTQGRSLRPWVDGETLEYEKTFSGRMVLRNKDSQGEFKLFAVNGAWEFYDLDADPGELDNIAKKLRQTDPDRLTAANVSVAKTRRECDLVMNLIGAKTGAGPRLNKRQLDELRQLGYVE